MIIIDLLAIVVAVYTGVFLIQANRQTEFHSKLNPSGQFTNDIADAEQLIRIGNKLMDEDKYEEAIYHYNRALELDSTFVGVLVDRGSCYYVLHEYDKALSDFTAALALQPDHPIAHFNAGIVCGALGNDSMMVSYWEKYLELEPEGELADRIRQFLNKHKNAKREKDKATTE